jgi:hypothetical protein
MCGYFSGLFRNVATVVLSPIISPYVVSVRLEFK